jgi:ABC-2 type transport system ATP-binding protein
MSAVEVRGLFREFTAGAGKRPVNALDGLDLTVAAGEIRGLLGPNGAGKTTLCKILSTVLLPTAGTARVLGYDVVTGTDRVKHSIGIVFGGDRGLYGRLTAAQNLKFWGALYGLRGAQLRRRTGELLERTGLAGHAGQRVDLFSRGMKQRLHLARGLIADAPVLILDEPTVGMDPVAARDFRVLIRELRAAGRTVLLTTHDLAEAEAVCDHITLIDHGRELLTGGPDHIGAVIFRLERIDAAGVSSELETELRGMPGVVSLVRRAPTRVRIETDDPQRHRAVLLRLVQAGVTELSTGRPGLEEVYLHVIGDRAMRVDR